MHYSFHRHSRLFVRLFFLGLIFLGGSYYGLVERTVTSGVSPCVSHKNLSVLARAHSKLPESPLNKSGSRATEGAAVAPINQLSASEQLHFPDAMVVAATEVEGPEPDQKTRLRLLKTHFKYPYVRTEEIIDAQTHRLITRQEMVADHLIVTLPKGSDPQIFLKQLGSQAVSIVRVTEDAPLYQVLLSSHSLNALPSVLDLIVTQGTSSIIAEPDFISHAFQSTRVDYFQYQWALQESRYFLNNTTNQWEARGGIDAVGAWSIRNSADPVVVAVIDSGIRYTHVDLAANMWMNPTPTVGDVHGIHITVDPTTEQTVRDGNVMDDYYHGTFCAGIIGANHTNPIGVKGVAPSVQLMACKFFDALGNGTDSEAAQCIDYAIDHGAQILNCSWGHVAPYSEALLQAFQRAEAKGVIIVAAAGNAAEIPDAAHTVGEDPLNNDLNPIYPANYPCKNIVAVASTTLTDELAIGSHYGATTVHLGAPGEAIISTTLRGAPLEITNNGAVGKLYISNPLQEKMPLDSSYGIGSGTSCAAPYVAGALALLAAQYPQASYETLIAQLLATTDQIPALAGKTISGGRLNVKQALMQVVTAQ